MKRIAISLAIADALVAGVAHVCFWGAHPIAGNVKSLAYSASKPEISAPSTFGVLPASAKSNDYADCIHMLGRNVPEAEQNALVAWITGAKPAQFSDSEWRYLVNEVMDSLCHQNQTLPVWSDTLIRIARGKTYDPGLRDYAIQHLVERIQPLQLGEPYESAPETRQAIITTILEAAGDTEREVSGTAVLGLHHILQGRQRSERHNEPSAKLPLPFADAQLRPLAVRLATAENSTKPARTTALQVCAERGFEEALPAARRIACDPAAVVSLRISAIGALGMLGQPEDRAILEKLQAGHHRRLEMAITPALNRLLIRNNISVN